MINVCDIEHGWATISIGCCQFSVSYLSDFVYEIDDLLNLSDENSVKKIVLDGESQGNLSLVSHLTFENVNEYLNVHQQRKDDIYDYVINIVWQCNCSTHGSNCCILKFPYKEFIAEWKKIISDDKFKEIYDTNFLMNEERGFKDE